MPKEKVTTTKLREMKKDGQKFAMVTAYDYPTAQLVDQSEIEMILVGDSLGMVMLGYDSTVPVTMDEMIHHIKAVVRGAPHTFVVGDLPFGSYNVSVEQAIENSTRILKEGGADCVKLEGGFPVVETVRALVRAGIPVMGHIGLTPQTASQVGGFKVQGKDADTAKRLLEEAVALEEAGIFSLVLECIPAELAKLITERISVPTIGIGAGVHCDGQVLVFHDMLGLFQRFVPKFVKQYANLGSIIKQALNEFHAEVVEEQFPELNHSFSISEEVLAAIKGTTEGR
ncbi:3-methyl-2-oxobutanoate hydroxymethyltransferase [Calderihabitans maritimus]|uniref:3-methyl-2-oxobutanoate hydroxymethyltransferase n=1 Tax=Calderihabitans maritimus TaxID=1246530 RepID=A0A1Z5HRF0_9FIRM|nr:3-methyl-2-oxobutanoate hydroxymethyltransferase [Calderihabitans maritimus]GAW92084.1 3-methyl-2-oxobutanoate hydroxymethyltransferase [Calderihabitans maritimus]